VISKFRLDQEKEFRAWLDASPRAVVLWRGVGCDFSARFQPHYARLDGERYSLGQRWVEYGAEGPVGDRYQLNLTPTLVAYRDGIEAARLEAAAGIGIRPEGALSWIRALAP